MEFGISKAYQESTPNDILWSVLIHVLFLSVHCSQIKNAQLLNASFYVHIRTSVMPTATTLIMGSFVSTFTGYTHYMLGYLSAILKVVTWIVKTWTI